MKLKNKSLNRTHKIFFITIFLFIIAAVYFFTDSNGTLSRRNTNFAVKSTKNIDKIRVSAQNKDEDITLSRKGGQWSVNNKYLAREFAIKNLIKVLSGIDIFKPVSNVQKEQIRILLKNEGLQVEIYKNNRRINHYLVSTPQINDEKTYMMKDRGEPYEVRIPSFNGLVADFYTINENFWRDKIIFDYQPENIQNILVEYPLNKNASFQLINYNDGTFAVKRPLQDSYIKDFDVERVMRYFTYFHDIAFEKIDQHLSVHQTDSIINSTPFCEISVTNFNHHTNSISFYRKAPEKAKDEFGNKVNYDYDRAYAVFNQNNELIIIQYYIFDPLLKEIDYFR